MPDDDRACACSNVPTLIFACSGAADTGEIADRAARHLRDSGVGKMYCLAGVGGKVGSILETTRVAANILAIDGCPTNCARKTLEEAGFGGFAHLQITDLGLEKGRSAVTEENVALVERRVPH